MHEKTIETILAFFKAGKTLGEVRKSLKGEVLPPIIDIAYARFQQSKAMDGIAQAIEKDARRWHKEDKRLSATKRVTTVKKKK